MTSTTVSFGYSDGGLEADADARLERVGAGRDVDAEDLAWPPSGARRPSRISTVVVLPAPFGPEQAEDLAAGDVEVDAVDGDEVAVALDQPADADDRIGRDAVPGAACRRMVTGRAAVPVAPNGRAPAYAPGCRARRTSRCRGRRVAVGPGRPRAPGRPSAR